MTSSQTMCLPSWAAAAFLAARLAASKSLEVARRWCARWCTTPESSNAAFWQPPCWTKMARGFGDAGLKALRQLGRVSGLFLLCLWLWVQLQLWCRSGYIVCHEILPAKCILKPNKEEAREETNMKASKWSRERKERGNKGREEDVK